MMFPWILASAVWSAVLPAQPIYFPPPGETMEQQSRTTPPQAGFDPGVIGKLRGKAARWALWRWGRLIHVEGGFNHKQDVASLRKTWHAMTVGAAIQQRRIPSHGQKLSAWLPDLNAKDAESSWWHVITQSSGFDYPHDSFPAYRPGQMWTYSDKNPRRLCDALARVYGKKHHRDHYEEVLRAAYFDAIGMRGWEAGFSRQDDGIRLLLDLEDMGRLGLLALARGAWNGAQLIPRQFVEELETKRTSGMRVNYDGPDDGKIALDPKLFPEAPYGFMTWVNTAGDYYPGADPAWAWGSGSGGHYILWNRNNGVVFAAQGREEAQAPVARGIPHILEESLAGAVSVVRDIPYAHYSDRQLRLDLYLPAGKTESIPGVIVVRGGGWRQGDKQGFARIAEALAARGFAAASIEYRVLPEAKFPAAVHDTKVAVRWMRAEGKRYGIHPGRIGAIGGSAGGHLVALLATSAKIASLEGDGCNRGISSHVQAVVAMAPVVDFAALSRGTIEFLGSSREQAPELWALASPVTHLDAGSAPMLLMHSKTDRTVPYQQSLDMLARAKKAGVAADLVTLEEAPHAFWNSAQYFQETIDRAAAFFNSALVSPQGAARNFRFSQPIMQRRIIR